MNRMLVLILAVMVLMTTGCDDDERLAELSRQMTAQQAEQNDAMARVTQEAAEAQRRTLEAAEQTRQATAAMQADLQQQRNQLDEERKSLAEARVRDSLLATVLAELSPLLLGMLPVVLCLLLLKSLRNDAATAQELSEILARKLSGDSLLLLPAPPPAAGQALPHRTQLLSPSEHRRLPF
jgi:Sec-independent protein translocase protein TatA